MGFCESFSKMILIIFNILFFIIGAAILGVGIWVKVDKSNLFEVLRKIKIEDKGVSFANTNTTILDVIAIVLIVFGTFTFVTGFCGCCGAIKENKILLITYSVLVGAAVITEIGIGIYAGVEEKKFTAQLGNSLKELIKKDFNGVFANDATQFTKIFTAIMFDLKCCGIVNERDFTETNLNWTYSSGKLQYHPVGCCKLKTDFKYTAQSNLKTEEVNNIVVTENCPFQNANVELNNDGCINALINLLKRNLGIVIGICIGLGLFEIFCIVFACIVARKQN